MKRTFPDDMVTVVGTNGQAASTMLKTGTNLAVTGKNVVAVNCRKADIIVTFIHVVISDAILGRLPRQ